MLQKKRIQMTPSVEIQAKKIKKCSEISKKKSVIKSAASGSKCSNDKGKSKPQEKLSEDKNNPHRRWINLPWNEKDNKPNESDKKTLSLLLEYTRKNLERLYELRASIKQKILQYEKDPESDPPQRYSKRNIPRVTYTEEDVSSDDDYVHCDRCDKPYDRTCEQMHGPMIHILDNEVSPDPRFAWRTCPVLLSVRQSGIKGAGLGVWTEHRLIIGVMFGPYKGTLVKNAKEARSSGYAWEIYRRGRVSHVIDGSDTTVSNWMRFVNCATCEEHQNLIAFQYKGELYYRTYKSVKAFTELLVWYGDEYGANLGIYRHEEKPVQNDIMRECDVSKDKTLPSLISYSHKSLHEKNDISNNKQHCRTSSSQISRKRKVNQHLQESQFSNRVPGGILINDNAIDTIVLENGNKMDAVLENVNCDNQGKRTNTTKLLPECSNKGERHYKCPKCDYASAVFSDIRLHMNGKHEEEKSYMCDKCDFSSSTKKIIQRHMHSAHFGRKHHECEMCDYSSTKKSNVQIHMDAVHYGKKPYKCDICDYSATQKRDIQKHMDAVHYGKKPYKCDI